MRVFLLFLLGTVIGAFSLFAQNAPVRKVWDKTFGGKKTDLLNTVIPTSYGGYLLGGTSLSDKGGDKSEQSKGENDYWIVNTDKNGTKIWDKVYGGNGYEDIYSILSTVDSGYLLCGGSRSSKSGDKTDYDRGGSDFWIVKIDANGNKLWDKTFGGRSDDVLNAAQATIDGGYILCGRSSGRKYAEKSEDSKGGEDFWILKIDAQGNKLWDKTFGSDNYDWFGDMFPTRDGGFLLGGTSTGNRSADKSEDSKGEHDYWIFKIDAQGNKLWDKTFGGSGSDRLTDLINTPDGGFLLGGYSLSNKSGDKSENNCDTLTATNSDFWIVKTDSAGNKLWDRTFGGNKRDELNVMLPTVDGGFLLGGSSSSSASCVITEISKGLTDFWIVKIDSNGNKLWDKSLGGSSYEEIYSIIPITDGDYILAGVSSSNSGGDKSEDCRGDKGYSDYWIIKIAIDPTGITETTPNDIGLSVYPNPSYGTLTINHPGTEALTLELMDAKGSLLRTLSVNEPATELTGLASGLYLLRFTTGSGKTHTQKIVVH